MFESSEPRDTVYAILALAKDSHPSVEGIPDYLYSRELTPKQKKALSAIARLLPPPLQQKYHVDYKQRVVDVYQQFISFAINKGDPTRALDIICRPFAQPVTERQDVSFDRTLVENLKNPEDRTTLPTWIVSRDKVPFKQQTVLRKSDTHGTEQVLTMIRQRGDPFVSTPDTISYFAAGSKALDKKKIRFRRRGQSYSMFVEGFVLDTVHEVDPAAQLGNNIPASWLQRGERHRASDPDAFWKTLVADRSPKGAAPLYYKNTIEAALEQAGISATFDISTLIEEKTSQLISDVLRHVQATVCERSLIETKRGLLGLGPDETKEDDLVCILYGCSVPVILRRFKKTPYQMKREQEADEKDRAEREQRVLPMIEKFFKRERERQQKRRPKSTPPARVEVCLDRVLQRPTRRIALLTTFCLIASLFRERLTASVLLVLALLHLLVELDARLTGADGLHLGLWKSDVGFSLFMLVAFIGAHIALAPPHTVLASGVLAGFNAVFPELLPTSISNWYIDRITLVVDWSVSFLAEVLQKARQAAPEQAAATDDAERADAAGVEPEAAQDPVANTQDRAAVAAPSNATAPTVTRVKKGPVDPKPLAYYYEVVGESYIHNMMNGEAIQWQNEHALSGGTSQEGRPEIFELH